MNMNMNRWGQARGPVIRHEHSFGCVSGCVTLVLVLLVLAWIGQHC